MDEVFRALADPARRELLDRLNARNGQTLRELGDGLGMARQSVSKHLAVLEAAGLVTTMRRGREKLHHLDAGPITAIFRRWVRRYDIPRAETLAALADRLEGNGETTMGADAFVYTSYIRATPEQVWQAITDPGFTRQYWQVEFETDWQAGSPMVWTVQDKVRIADPEQVVLISEPPHRLSYTFHTMTPEFAATVDMPEDQRARLFAQPRSKVTFEIEQLDGKVKLTVVHDDLDADGELRGMISGGWPELLSDLKTLLETGAVPA
ncbi:metalloregulator ArsR/SmtB family transcription factor [Nakamurella sp. YIM 132087]|uniref:Metalloregulator ArsR/SmtB family transcription factor n=1 Tax=Nakamurella alba TaxID=2665158 RepID=A0A7K1FJ29_9ACTN|nr:metalloregulator ArsR/SmtB family transcription factor [Nakamurella alba]MTD14122.1 metalloregulator ArsR/SmtB family transcription factor [Nakamurella alba]